jgi:hypothetical protein
MARGSSDVTSQALGSLGFLGTIRRTVFQDCRFVETHLSDVFPGQARFVRCFFAVVEMTGWADAAAEFVDCRFADRLHQCRFWGSEHWAREVAAERETE